MSASNEHHAHGDDRVGHGHQHPRGALGWLRALYSGHEHSPGELVDDALETSLEGVRALRLSLLILGLTTVFQVGVVALSGSVALLGDALHNLGDAMTALPLWVAFTLGRRPRTQRYTHGYGRAEDLAGILIVVVIALSAAIASYESIRALIDPREVRQLGWVAAAALVGFTGNELVAIYRIRVGRRIGSAALVADGVHARVDGLTSLAVLLGVGGVALGWRLADPIVGLAISVAILLVLRGAAREVYHRLMDAVDPTVVSEIEAALADVSEVVSVDEVRVRWIGHSLRAEVQMVVDNRLSLVDAHAIAEKAHHAVLHRVPRLTSVIVHADPPPDDGNDHHGETAHHYRGLAEADAQRARS